MGRPVKPPRPYRSELRREQALETRRRVLDAAHDTFVQHGYGGATINAVAASAGVSAETVYAVFGNKRTLLAEVMRRAVRGDHPVPVLEQPGPRAVAAASDPRERLRLFAADVCERLARAAPLMLVLGAAASEEPELEELRRTMHAARRENLRTLAAALEADGDLSVDVDAATETIWALASPELYSLLLGQGGWTRAAYEAWLAQSLDTLLLRP